MLGGSTKANQNVLMLNYIISFRARIILQLAIVIFQNSCTLIWCRLKSRPIKISQNGYCSRDIYLQFKVRSVKKRPYQEQPNSVGSRERTQYHRAHYLKVGGAFKQKATDAIVIVFFFFLKPESSSLQSFGVSPVITKFNEHTYTYHHCSWHLPNKVSDSMLHPSPAKLRKLRRNNTNSTYPGCF